MRIISNFRDYYDGVGSYGGYETEGRIWIRHRREAEPFKTWKDLMTFIPGEERYDRFRLSSGLYQAFGKNDINNWRLAQQWELPSRQAIVVGVAGKLYRGYALQRAVEVPTEYGYSRTDTLRYFVYSFDQVDALGDLYELSPENPFRNPDSWQAWLNTEGIEAVDIFRAHDVATFLFVGPLETYRVRSASTSFFQKWADADRVGEMEVLPNPVLRDLGFGAVMDAYTVYQELDMFVSNALIPSDPPNPSLTESQMVEQKGFDPKYGFRTRP